MEPQDKKLAVALPAVFLLAGLLIAGAVVAGYRMQRAHLLRTAVVRSTEWPEQARLAAGLMIERYGPPDRQGWDSMTWLGRRPWTRIVVRGFPPSEPLTQTLRYDFLPGQAERINRFGRGVSADVARGELSAHGDGEPENFLALNLADEVARGARTPVQARRYHGRTLRLMASGKSSAYADGLLFEPAPF